MKAKAGDRIKLIEKVCYGSAYGLVEVEKDTVLHVANRNISDDGIETVEEIALNNGLGKLNCNFNVWDSKYIII